MNAVEEKFFFSFLFFFFPALFCYLWQPRGVATSTSLQIMEAKKGLT